MSFDCLLTLMSKRQFYRGIAQLEERLLWEQEAAGSRPATSAREKLSSEYRAIYINSKDMDKIR